MSRKLVLVTGGAKGIGRAIVTRLAESGYDIIFTYRNSAQEAHALLDELSRQYNIDIFAEQCDLSLERETLSLGEKLSERPVYGLIYNAGTSYDCLTATFNEERAKQLMQINFWSFATLFKCIARTMLRQKSSRVVAVSSIASLRGNKGNGPYAASKAALAAYVRVIASEYGKKGLIANTIAPGFVNTDMLTPYTSSLTSLTQSIPMKRFAEPTEIAELANFLLSDKCGYLTGETIAIDGGMTNCG